MTLYADSEYPVREDLDVIHTKQINQLAEPGTWGTGAQRLAIANEVRQACYDAGTQEKPKEAGPVSNIELPEAARNMVRKLAVSPKDFLEDSYQEAKKGDLSDEEYVEIVGIVSRVTNMDVFARGIGVDLRALPAARTGEPSRERPGVAKPEQAWVPTIPNLPEGGDIAAELYGEGHKTYIVRGVSLVPDELRMHMELEEIQYLPLQHIMVADYQHHEGFSRAQSEIVAGRVSALNECFF